MDYNLLIMPLFLMPLAFGLRHHNLYLQTVHISRMLAAQFISSELWMKLHAHHFLVQFTVIYKHQLKFNVKQNKKKSPAMFEASAL